MSFTVEIESEGRGFVVSFKGPVTGDEMLRANKAEYARDPSGNADYSIWDFSDVESIKASSDELRKVALQDYDKTHVNRNERVAIVGPEQLLVGLSGLILLYAEVWTELEVKMFPSMSQARKWAEHGTKKSRQ